MEISHFYVLEHDGIIIGCAALYPFADVSQAELACMAVNSNFRGGGRGERLLHFCEEEAKKLGIRSLFVLTTRTAHWFVERGYVEADVSALPPAKQQLYNYQRRSKVFIKQL
jgi:amino-acid N-acetyltransferase